jgi:predicted hydrocarbon binding protein
MKSEARTAPAVAGGNYYAEGLFCHTDVRRGVTRTRSGDRICCLTTDFLIGFRRAIVDECGPAADTVFRSCGKKWGGLIAKRFEQDMAGYYGTALREFTLAKTLANLADYFSHHGWGRVTFDLTRHDQGLILVTATEPVYADLVGKSEKPVESLTAGMLAGLASELFGQDLDCVQTKCKAVGHDAAVFVIGLTTRLAGVPGWLDAGKNHDQILRELASRERPLAAGGDRVVTNSAFWECGAGIWTVRLEWPEPISCAVVGPHGIVTATVHRLTRWDDVHEILSRSLDSRPATLRLALTGDGRVAAARLGERSEVVFLSENGDETDRCPLPGLVRSVVSVGPDVVVRVLTGSGYRLVRVGRDQGPERLWGSADVLALATDYDDLIAAWADGRIAEWRADEARIDYRVAPLGGRVLSLLAGPTHITLLTAGSVTTVVCVPRPKR